MSAFTRATSIVTVVVGVAIIARTIAAGGGPLALGVLVGILFVAAGAGRLYIQVRGEQAREEERRR